MNLSLRIREVIKAFCFSISLAILALGYPVLDIIRINPVLSAYFGLTKISYYLLLASCVLVPSMLSTAGEFFEDKAIARKWLLFYFAILCSLLILSLFSAASVVIKIGLISVVTLLSLGLWRLDTVWKNIVWTLSLLAIPLAVDYTYKAIFHSPFSHKLSPPDKFDYLKNPPLTIVLMLDGTDITTQHLDSDRWPKESLLPNLHSIFRQDFQWFPNSVSISPQTQMSIPAITTGEVSYKEAIQKFAAGWDFLSILSRNYKVNGYFYRDYYKDFCSNHDAQCLRTMNANDQESVAAIEIFRMFFGRLLFGTTSQDLKSFRPEREKVSFNEVLRLVEQGQSSDVYYAHIFRRSIDDLKQFDEEFLQLVTLLKEKKTYEDALIILLADHGLDYAQGAHQYGVLAQPTTEVYSIPVAIKAPGLSGKLHKFSAQQTDVVPTLLSYFLAPASLKKLNLKGVNLLDTRQHVDRTWFFNCTGSKQLKSLTPDGFKKCK